MADYDVDDVGMSPRGARSGGYGGGRRAMDQKNDAYKPIIEPDGRFACPMKVRGCKFSARYSEGVDSHINKCSLVLIDPFLTNLTAQAKELQKVTSDSSKQIRTMKQDAAQFKDLQDHEVKMLKKAIKHKDIQLAELKEALRMAETEIEVPIEKHYELDSEEQKRQAIYFITRQSEKLYSIVKEILIKKADRAYCDIMISKLEDQMEMIAEKAARIAVDKMSNELKTMIEKKVPVSDYENQKELILELKRRVQAVEEKEMRLRTALVDPDSFLELQQTVDSFRKEFLSTKEKQKRAVDSVSTEAQKTLSQKMTELNRLLVLKADQVDITRLEEIVNNTMSVKRRARGKNIDAIKDAMNSGGGLAESIKILEKEVNDKVALDDFASLHMEVEKMAKVMNSMNASQLANGKTTMEAPMGLSSQKCVSCERPLPFVKRAATTLPGFGRRTGALRLQKTTKKPLYDVSTEFSTDMHEDPLEPYVKSIYNLGLSPETVMDSSIMAGVRQ